METKELEISFQVQIWGNDMKNILSILLSLLSIVCFANITTSLIAANKIQTIHMEEDEIVIPDGYVAIEYLESTGTQYIDAQYVLSSEDIVICKAMPKNRNSIFGYFKNGKHFNLTGSGNSTLFRFGDSNIGIQTVLNNIYLFECGKTFAIDGNIQRIFINTFTTDGNCVLFARNSSDNTSTMQLSDYFIGRIYFLKIKNNNVLVRYFIPVRSDEGENSIGYMYDAMSGEMFENKGSGSFILGPDVENN